MTHETEVKIPIGDLGISLDEACLRMARHGFVVHKPRVFERNLVFDTQAGELRASGRLLRLREAGGRTTLTYKGVAASDTRHKSREERETTVGAFSEMRVILERLSYEVTFIYEKYRTEYAEPASSGSITLDETPVGNFLELEGEPDWIDATAILLGFDQRNYLKSSYSKIYSDWCQKSGVAPTNMRFG